MTYNRNTLVLGCALIVIGLLFLTVNFSDYGWEEFWPLLMIAGGLTFLAAYIVDRRNYGFLMPATILTAYGILFQSCALTEWEYMEEWWPTFILAPGLGLLAMYFGGKRETGLLVPATILIGLASLFFVVFGPLQAYEQYWPVLLILAGVALLLRRRETTPQSLL
ncbi:MAG: hypothetical protein AAB354_04440 [candidate division KSB1 bacterium]